MLFQEIALSATVWHFEKSLVTVVALKTGQLNGRLLVLAVCSLLHKK